VFSPPPTNWKFYLRSADAWEAMYADCDTARASIDIEQFIFGDDKIGKRFLELLGKKAAEGVKIRIMCDAVGSSDLLNSEISGTLAEKGISIVFFNRIQPWRIGNISSWFLRDHRKILLIDRNVAHIGGVNIEDRMENWRDTNVRLMGPVVSEIQTGFDRMWTTPTRHKFSQHKPLFKAGEDFSFLLNSPQFRGRYIYHDLRRNIRNAKKYIYLTTPYFVPSILIFTSLIQAARRGVDVRILVPGSSDVQVARIAAGSYFLLALNAGIKIYCYDERTFLHTKTGIIDGAWGSIGSANIDNLSLLLNFEGNLISSDPLFIADLQRQFIDDLSVSQLLTKEKWINRPIILKILEIITWPLHGIL
jgi:cardiolipin synthase